MSSSVPTGSLGVMQNNTSNFKMTLSQHCRTIDFAESLNQSLLSKASHYSPEKQEESQKILTSNQSLMKEERRRIDSFLSGKCTFIDEKKVLEDLTISIQTIFNQIWEAQQILHDISLI